MYLHLQHWKHIKLTRSSRSTYKIINPGLLFGHQQKNGDQINLSNIPFWHYIFFNNVHFNIICFLKITALLQIGNLPSAPLHCIKTIILEYAHQFYYYLFICIIPQSKRNLKGYVNQFLGAFSPSMENLFFVIQKKGNDYHHEAA